MTIGSEYKKHRTNRIEDDSDVIIAPRSFDKSLLFMKCNINLIKGNRINIQGQFLNTSYVTREDREFYYNEYKLKSSLQQMSFKSDRNSHSLGKRYDYSVRYYVDNKYDEKLNKKNMKERKCTYHNPTGKYIWKLKKKAKLTLGMTATERFDVIQNKFGYHQ
ncbi:MAG: single-stranded DNA-binding protein [Saprospiraceae bacterium]